MMKLGIHIGTFPRSNLAQSLDAVAANHLQCVHFNFKVLGLASMPEAVDEAVCQHIAGCLAERQLEIASLSGTFNMIHPDVSVRHRGLRRLETVAQVARRLNVPVIALCTGTRDPHDMWRPHPDNTSAEAWSDLLEAMAAALSIAERYEVVLGVEPEVANVVDSAQKARKLLDHFRSPHLGVIVDGANLLRPEDLPHMEHVLRRAFELLGQDIVLAHAKEINRQGHAGGIPPGQGVLDWHLYLSLLAQCRPHCPVILHSLPESTVPGAVAFLAETLDRLRR